MALQNAFANLMLDTTAASLKVVDPDGTQQVSPEPSTLFIDDFSNSNLNTWWSTNGSPAQSNGNVSMAPGTTASGASFMRTNGSFRLQTATYLRISMIVQHEAAAIANSGRWWGYGSLQGTPTAAAPLLNGAAFYLDPTAGALQAVTFSGGTKTVVATLTRQTDAAQHRYEIWYRQSIIYWIIDGVTVASKTFPNLYVATNLNGTAGSVNNTTAPSTAPILNLSSFAVADHGANNKTLSDGVQPWIVQSVKTAQPTVIATDNPGLVLALPAVGQVVTGYSASSATAVTATVPAPGAGLRNYITSVTFERFALAAMTASGTPIVTTAGNHAFVMTLPQDAAAIGVKTEYPRIFPSAGIASTAQNTATTFTAPAVTNASWRVTVTYYVAP